MQISGIGGGAGMTTSTDGVAIETSERVLLPKTVAWRSFVFIAQVLAIAVVILSSIFCYGTWHTGSFKLVWPWLMGQQLVFTPTRIELGHVEANQEIKKQIRVNNVSSKHFSIVGSQRSCGCIGLEKLPITLAPHHGTELQIMLNTSKTSGTFEHQVKFFTNCTAGNVVVVSITGVTE